MENLVLVMAHKKSIFELAKSMSKFSDSLMNKHHHFYLLLLALYLSLQISTFAQDSCRKISMNEVSLSGALTMGTYSQLVDSIGAPQSVFPSTINPINPRYLRVNEAEVAPKDTITCEYLVYDAYTYLRVKDSVQLVVVDIQKIDGPILIGDLEIYKSTTRKHFITEMAKRNLWSQNLSEERTSSIDDYYQSHKKVKNLYIDYEEDPYSFAMFTFFDNLLNKKIWWIEFPIMRVGGIFH